MSQSGIYEIVNAMTGHRYVGSAVKLDKRRREHFGALRRGDHRSVVLQRAFDKYGEHILVFRPLLLCEPENLLFYEQRALDSYQPEYNICKVAGSRLGAKYSAEARKRLSDARRGSPRSQAQLAHLARLAEAARGHPARPHSADAIAKIKAARARQVITPEHRAAIAAASIGRKHTAETIEKIRAAKVGVKRGPMSAEQKAKLAAVNAGRKHSAEARERMRAARLGTKWSPAQYIARGLVPPEEC